MAGEYPLRNGIETDWILHDSTWKKGVDRNWKDIDWTLYKEITEVVNVSGDIPASPANGDAFLIETAQEVWVWIDEITQFHKIPLSAPFIFYDLDSAGWFEWLAGVIGPFGGGGGSGDVVGPASAVDDRIATFNGTTGKLIQDGGMTIADVIAASGGSGTVTSVSVVTANGVSGSVATATTTPAITLTLGAITPSSVAASGTVTGSNLSGTNTGDQTITLTGDVTGSGTGSFAATIANDSVTFAKFQNITTNRLLGRATGGSGDMEEITLGTGLSFAGTTLNVTAGAGSVTSVDVTTANGVSATGGPITTSGSFTFSLGAITPTSVNGVTFSGSGSLANSGTSSLTGFTGSGTSSGTNTGNQTITLTGDITGTGTGSFATTLATVNANVGSFGSATQVAAFTVNAKGLTTAASNVTITPAASSITGGAALTKTDDTNVTLTLGGSPSTALLAAASLTLGWTGTLSGTRGGTGVNNGASTITLGGSLSHAGAFTQTFTATGNTSLTLPTTGTLATLAGTETFTNKTIGVTQLNSAAYTFPANNTSGAANHTAIAFRDTGITAYTETIAWTGTTAPSGTLTANYAWVQIAGQTTLQIAFHYVTAGTANTSVSCPIPTGAPAPNEWTTWGAANEKLYAGWGYVDGTTTGAPGAARVYLLVNTGDTGYNLNATVGSVNGKVGSLNVIYRT